MSGGSVDGKVVGGLLAALGLLAIAEGGRLYALRTRMVAGAVVGDDTFPILVGLALVVLGAAAAFARLPAVEVTFPRGVPRARMLLGAGVLAAYWFVVPHLGYTASTVLASVGLYRGMGGYRWPVSLLLGAVTTALLHLVFRVWLREPLPGGWFGT